MKSLARLALATAVLFTAADRATSAPPVELDHGALAERFLEKFERGGSSASDFELDELLAAEFVTLRLGLFDLYFPFQSLADKSARSDLQRVAQALLDAQERWLDWIALPKEEAAAAEDEVKVLRGWIKSWKLQKWEAGEPGSNLALELSAADEEVRSTSEVFAERMGVGSDLGLERSRSREPVVLFPERELFVEAIAFAGWLRSDLEHEFWKDDIHTWTNFYLERYKFLAMDYASPGGSAERYGESMDMSARTPTGLEQQTVQLCMNSLIDNYFGDKVPPTFAGGLAINLVVDLFEECNTRADGDLSERRTEAVEIFVPGGNPSGGFLGTIGADSRWRDGQGEDRFVKVLRNSQKGGAKEMKKKKELVFFELRDEAGREKKVLSAPFLGAKASEREEIPAAFEGDQLEFLRAYRCAFLWWLQNESLGKEKASRAGFAAFLKKVAMLESAAEIEGAFAECFEGAPLSSPELDRKGDLEGRFLYWLSRK